MGTSLAPANPVPPPRGRCPGEAGSEGGVLPEQSPPQSVLQADSSPRGGQLELSAVRELS